MLSTTGALVPSVFSGYVAHQAFPSLRKAPQYPWPCPLQDVLAAYLYLTSPPEGALHKPVPPSKIVVAGDSAGAGLSIALLTVLLALVSIWLQAHFGEKIWRKAEGLHL